MKVTLWTDWRGRLHSGFRTDWALPTVCWGLIIIKEKVSVRYVNEIITGCIEKCIIYLNKLMYYAKKPTSLCMLDLSFYFDTGI